MQRLKEEVKKRILDAGKRRFKEDGFENASMRQIAADAKISTGNIYRYFLTKSHLFSEILNEQEEEMKAFLDSIPENYDELKNDTLFKNLADKIIELYEKREVEIQILFNSIDQRQFIIFREKIFDMFSKKVEALAKSINENFTDKVLPAAIARSLFEGIAYIVKENDSNIDNLRKKLYTYMEIMVIDLDKRVIDTAKRVS